MATIADKLNLLQQTKADIKQAIINKGVEVSDEDNFPSYAGKINSISTSGSGFNIPNGTTFRNSKWESIPNEVLQYANTGTYGFYLLSDLTLESFPNNITLYPYDSAYFLYNLNIYSYNLDGVDKITLDFSRIGSIKQVWSTFGNNPFKEIELKNTSEIFRYYNVTDSVTNPMKITGIDMTSTTTFNGKIIGDNWGTYIGITNLGYAEGLTSVNLSAAYRLGMELEEYPISTGATQALKDSLITNSFDRATAGYPVCSISLSTNTKALLSEDEIAQITAKGYTIA